MKKVKTLLLFRGLNLFAVPDVKSYIMALLHKYKTREKGVKPFFH